MPTPGLPATLALLCSLHGASLLHAQDLRFGHLTTADGMPDNHVTAILQDHLGLMWFGTTVGLVKYDGYTFTVYQPVENDPTSISAGGINELYEDAAGDLWIGTDHGLNRLDRATGRLTRYLHDPDDSSSLPDNRVWALAASAATPDLLWIGTPSGLSRFHPASGVFSPVPADPEDLPTPFVLVALYEAPSEPGILWMGAGTTLNSETQFPGLVRFDTATESFTTYRFDTNDPAYANSFVFRILEDRTERLWLSSDAGLLRFDRKTGAFDRVVLPSANLSDLNEPRVSLHQDPEGTLWFGTVGGRLGRLDPSPPTRGPGSLRLRSGQAGETPATEAFTWYRHEPGDPTSLGSNTVIPALYSDRDGILWIGTRGGGLSILDRSAPPFVSHVHDPEQAQSIGAGNVRAILEDRSGTLWIGKSQNGLDRWDRSAGTITHYRNDPANPRSLGPGEIVALYEDTEGALWVGACPGGLARFEAATRSPGSEPAPDAIRGPGQAFTRFPYDPDGSGGSIDFCVNAIFEDRAGRFWVGTFGSGLYEFDKAAGTFTPYRHEPGNPQSLPGDYILAHLEARDGSLWFGLDGSLDRGGLVRFDPSALLSANGGPPENGPFSPYLSARLRVMALHEDRTGQLWAGTAGDGLIRFDRETGRHTNYTTADGLAHDIVWAILEDDAGDLWISTDNGLSRFDPRAETFQNYDARDGLHGHIFGERAAFKSPSGELFFGGQTGMTSFFPDRIAIDTRPPPVVLTEFRVAGVPVEVGEGQPLQTHINVAEEVTLSHEQKDVSISFAALSYRRPEKNRYAFYLENYEETWRPPGPARTAAYTNLDPGAYLFRVRASNREGVWNETGASLRIRVLPPWWRTTWAYGLYGLLFVGGVFGVDRVQRRRLLAREREKAMEREREQAREIERAHTQLQRAHEHLKTTQARLVQQEKLASLGQLTAGIAHEIKNPLNFVTNFAELNEELARDLRDAFARGGDPEELLADLEQNATVIAHHGKRADAIVQSMMEHATGGSGEREPAELNALVNEYIDLAYHGRQAQTPGLEVTIKRDFGADVGTVELVPQEIGRVLLNLLGNAFDAVQGRPEARVVVSTRRMETGVEVRISDNGPGIETEIRDRIFEPFFTTKPTGSGTGLGLSLSYDIVTQGHGGTLAVESEEGAGATFVVGLPG